MSLRCESPVLKQPCEIVQFSECRSWLQHAAITLAHTFPVQVAQVGPSHSICPFVTGHFDTRVWSCWVAAVCISKYMHGKNTAISLKIAASSLCGQWASSFSTVFTWDRNVDALQDVVRARQCLYEIVHIYSFLKNRLPSTLGTI